MLRLQALAALQLRPAGAAAVYAHMLSDTAESAEWPVLVALLRTHPPEPGRQIWCVTS